MKRARRSNAAYSMLELTVATAMLATVMGSVIVLVRTSHTAWEAHEQDLERIENVSAALRHMVRRVRQAESVIAISDPANISGQLSLLMPTGEQCTWQRKADSAVYYGTNSPNSLLAMYIDELSFTGYRADGITQTTDVTEIQLIACRAKTVLLHGIGGERTVRCRAWIRSW